MRGIFIITFIISTIHLSKGFDISSTKFLVCDLYFGLFIKKTKAKKMKWNLEGDLEEIRFLIQGFPEAAKTNPAFSCSSIKSFKLKKPYSLTQHTNYYLILKTLGCKSITPNEYTKKKVAKITKETYIKSFYELYLIGREFKMF